MRKLFVASAAILVVSLLSSCAYIAPRKIPTLGLKQDGKNECPVGERIYYYRDVDTAMCLPDVMVAYTHCVTELTVANSKSNLSTETKIDAAKIADKVEGLNLSDAQKRELEKAFEKEGAIGEARAKAIDACKEITMAVYGGTISSNIKAAQEKFLAQ